MQYNLEPIYFNRIDEAEELLRRAIIYMKLCQPENSNYLLLAMATLATLHKIFNKPKEAVNLFKHVVQHVGKWIMKAVFFHSFIHITGHFHRYIIFAFSLKVKVRGKMNM